MAVHPAPAEMAHAAMKANRASIGLSLWLLHVVPRSAFPSPEVADAFMAKAAALHPGAR
jgi:hypothetical protein